MKAVIAVLALAACGGGGDGGGDDAPDPDGPVTPSVMVVTPCAGETATIESLASRFDPASVTISMGQIVKISAGQVSDDHDIAPALSGTTDPALEVPGGQERCFRFTATGTFGFRCTIHGFVGSVVVQ
jgi:plastocyanin